MDSRLILYSIPAFLFLMLLEFILGLRKQKNLYRLNDTLADLNNGLGSQVVNLFVVLALASLMSWMSEHALFDWNLKSASVGALVLINLLLFLFVDFAYYWFHRASHRVNFLWAAHIVHHQSEEYNLAVALRQSWLQSSFGLMLYLPLLFLGLPAEALFLHLALNTVLQFWFHTQLISKMGFFESFLNTPSHHRVHHGRNPIYLDKNYAGVLIIWDKMFGSFQPETEPVVYGIVKPLNSWGTYFANIHYWAEIFKAAKKQNGLKNKIKIWFTAPADMGEPAPEVHPDHIQKFDLKPIGVLWWSLVAAGFLVNLWVLTKLLYSFPVLPANEKIFLSAALLLGIFCSGKMLENKKSAIYLEFARWLVLLSSLFYLQS